MRRLVLTLTAFLSFTAPAHAAWTWPVPGEVITPYRNGTDPYASGQHRGIDIAAVTGAPVVAAAGGEVLFSGTAGSSGVTISIRTGDGYDTSYLHLSSTAVQAGARVSPGERIGAVGTTGTRSATQPHLHFGVRTAGTRHEYHDPLAFLPPPPAPPAPSERPVPTPAPIPSTPPPVPAPAPEGRRLPAGRRVPRAAPGRAPRLEPRPAPGRLPRLASRPDRSGRVPGHAPRPIPVARPVPIPTRSPGPKIGLGRPTPLADGASRGAPAADPADAAFRAQEPTISSPGRRTDPGGPNLGWALACAGLLLAAGILGLTDEGRRRTARRRAWLAQALSPLLGRR